MGGKTMKYKKLWVSLLVFISVFLIYLFANDKKMNYIALGDSLAIGQNPYGQIGYGYADYISNYLKRNKLLKFYTKEFAESGDKIDDLLQDVKNNKTIQVDDKLVNIKSSLRESDLVTISIGANDFISSLRLDKNLDGLEEKNVVQKVDAIIPLLEETLKEIRKYAKKEIIVIGYYNPLPRATMSFGDTVDKLFTYADQAYQKICDRYQITYISVYHSFKNHNDYLPNPFDIHPNAKGYETISNAVIQHLEKKILN